jgi:hypothetical protein
MCLGLEVKMNVNIEKKHSHTTLEITILEKEGRWRTGTSRIYYIIFGMSYGIHVNWNVFQDICTMDNNLQDFMIKKGIFEFSYDTLFCERILEPLQNKICACGNPQL